MGINQMGAQRSMEKLSSGLRINRAGDDAAGLAISEKMRAQIRGLDQASRNAQDGISLIQTAEGALQETHSILQRMRELAVQSSNDTNNDKDREELQKEVDQLAQEITRISDNTEFNTKNLLGKTEDGELKAGFEGKFHIGANTGQDIKLSIANMSAEALKVAGSGEAQEAVAAEGTVQGITITAKDGTNYNVSIVQATGSGALAAAATIDGNTIVVTLGKASNGTAVTSDRTAVAGLISGLATGITASVATGGGTTVTEGTGTLSGGSPAVAEGEAVGGINISSQTSASAAITTINAAIERVSGERSMLGAVQNRLEHTISNLNNSSENLQAAESRIRDVDMAREVMEMTKNNILSQASQAMLAQANQAPQAVLQLLG